MLFPLGVAAADDGFERPSPSSIALDRRGRGRRVLHRLDDGEHGVECEHGAESCEAVGFSRLDARGVATHGRARSWQVAFLSEHFP